MVSRFSAPLIVQYPPISFCANKMPGAQSGIKFVSGHEMRRNSKRRYPLVMMLKKKWMNTASVLQQWHNYWLTGNHYFQPGSSPGLML
jgi:hypothetical protein